MRAEAALKKGDGMRIFIIALSILAGLIAPSAAQDNDAALNAIEAAYSAYETKPDKTTRKALLEALDIYDGAPNTTTVSAHLRVMVDDTYAAKPRELFKSATMAREHLEPIANVLPQQYIEARYVAAVAHFNDRQKSAAMLELAHVQGLANQINSDGDEYLEWATSLRYKSEAWRMAMEAYFQSKGERFPSDQEINTILSTYKADPATVNAAADSDETTEGQLPFCDGELKQRPKMRYPAGKAMRGMYGALLLELNFDETGQVVDPIVRASVPFEGFSEKALKTVSKWKYVAEDKKAVGVSCRLSRGNVILPMLFAIR